MKRILLIFLLLFISCGSSNTSNSSKAQKKPTKKEAFKKYTNGFVIQKLPNWEFHDFHGMLNYTPKRLMEVGREYIYNGVTATKRTIKKDETLQSIVDNYISMREKHNEIIKLERINEQTKYGESVVLVYTSEINLTKYKVIKQFYLHDNILYIVAYTAKSKFFDFFVNDAIHMMKTFTITE